MSAVTFPNVDRATVANIAEAAAMDDLDAACLHLQTIVGISDGGQAGAYFSGEAGENWPTLSREERAEHLSEWLRTEVVEPTTFEEWQGTRHRVEDMTEYGCEPGTPGFVYASGYIMIMPPRDGDPEQYEVLIENWFDEITPDLAAAEKMLWDNWSKDLVDYVDPGTPETPAFKVMREIK